MTLFSPAEAALVAALAAAALGYAVGRRIGRSQGRSEGVAMAPLALRVSALEAGFCPICGRVVPTDETAAAKVSESSSKAG